VLGALPFLAARLLYSGAWSFHVLLYCTCAGRVMLFSVLGHDPFSYRLFLFHYCSRHIGRTSAQISKTQTLYKNDAGGLLLALIFFALNNWGSKPERLSASYQR
jgi:hypothetical protein